MFAWRWQVNDGPVRQLDTAGGIDMPAAFAQDAALAELPTERSELSRYLARLAIDPEALAVFLATPEQAVDELSPLFAEALKSRDPNRIAMALFEQEPRK
jgi:hypothetical protein